VVVSDGEPVGMVCLWWSVPSVLGVGRMVCHSSSGEPVGLVAVVNSLDTLPAVSLWPWWCRMVSLWDGLPVVSTLDTLPACEPVASGEGVPFAVSRCGMVSLWDVWPVAGDWWPWSLWDWLPWSVPSTHCQR